MHVIFVLAMIEPKCPDPPWYLDDDSIYWERETHILQNLVHKVGL